jgi:hypothetical protein
MARAEKSAIAQDDLQHRGAAKPPQTPTQSCIIPRQRLQRFATQFARERDNLNRIAARATAMKIKKYD